MLLRLYGPMSVHADSVVMPLLVPDTPVVTWWPRGGPAAPSSSRSGCWRSAGSPTPRAPARRSRPWKRSRAGYRPGDTDLSWTRATTWRSLLAATLDQPHGEIIGGSVSAEAHNPTADLLAAWLTSRLGVPFSRESRPGPASPRCGSPPPTATSSISRPDGRMATLTRPGQPDRHVALHRRDIAELLAEELRRLNPDEVYGETLASLASARREVRHQRAAPGAHSP